MKYEKYHSVYVSQQCQWHTSTIDRTKEQHFLYILLYTQNDKTNQRTDKILLTYLGDIAGSMYGLICEPSVGFST